ncbi:uncharacterized protein LOC122508174 [Leptopilina heterotoma]|uniref:uncharacterized protein LOC122508174 n=1 Tax=Leptopilina heterotoma TaxID=63436 RepID=UPI001CA91D9B|nr:uncharacterized protein LOC122508174 [Leptopilina heterotoma]
MYNGKVLIGNWNEDRELEKVKIADYVKKRDNNELVIQKIRTLFHNMCREIDLYKTENYIEFGNRIQIYAPDVRNIGENNGETEKFGVIISVTIPRNAIGKIERFTDQMPIVCAAISEPCTRNTFTILASDWNKRDGEKLLFGQTFILKASE